MSRSCVPADETPVIMLAKLYQEVDQCVIQSAQLRSQGIDPESEPLKELRRILVRLTEVSSGKSLGSLPDCNSPMCDLATPAVRAELVGAGTPRCCMVRGRQRVCF